MSDQPDNPESLSDPGANAQQEPQPTTFDAQSQAPNPPLINKLSPDDPSLALVRQPVLNKKVLRVLITTLVGATTIGAGLGLSHHNIEQQQQQQQAKSAISARVPSNLAVTDKDYLPEYNASLPPQQQTFKPYAQAPGVSQAPAYPVSTRNYPDMTQNQNQDQQPKQGKPLVALPNLGTDYAVPFDDQERDSPLAFPWAPTPDLEGAALAAQKAAQAAKNAANTTVTLGQGNDYENQNMQKQKQEFINSQSDNFSGFLPDRPINPIDASHEITSGTIIPMTLITGINSDNPGEIVAQTTEPVWDSITATNILIPAGSRVIGQYSSAVPFGATRLLLKWDTLILPDGTQIDLQGMQGSDTQGQSGLAANVDNHIAGILAAVGLASIFDIGKAAAVSALSTTSFLQNLSTAMNAQGSMSTATQQAVDQIAQEYANKLINQQPTLSVPMGTAGTIIVSKTIVMPSSTDTQ